MMFQNTCKLVLECELNAVIDNLLYLDEDVNSIKHLLELYESVYDVCDEIDMIHQQMGIIYALRKLQLIDTHTWCTLHNKYVEAIDVCKVKLNDLMLPSESV